jgi:hypothetical protein
VSTPSTILTLPSVQEAQTLARHCLALGTIGVLTGPNGAGKSEALKYLARTPDLLPPNRAAYYFQAVQAVGSSRGVRDLLVGLEVRQAIHQRGMALPIAMKLALREFQDRGISLLLIDEADLLAIDALQGMISMYDFCRDKGHRMAIVCAGSKPSDKWIGALPAAWSRTLKVCHLSHLSVEITCALFEGWGSPVKELAQSVREKDREAVGTLKLIHKGTGGNLRRLYYFAELAALDPQPLASSRVRELMEQMTTHAVN